MSESAQPQIETLLSESKWAKALARRLVEDASEADELVQDTWIVALQQTPAKGTPILSWLARVIRNLARQRWRARQRREIRERRVAREEHVGPEQELLERFQQHRALAEEVAHLVEPYRGAILMRYFDGLAPEEIARRTNTPVRTVHSRLHRGLAQLRERLRRRTGGDERTWLSALLPLGFGRGEAAGSLIGGLIVSTQVKVAVSVVVLCALVATAVFWPEAEPLVPLAVVPDAAAKTTLVETDSPPAEEMETSERTALGSVRPIDRAETKTANMSPSIASFNGRVVDIDGRPLAGIEVGVCPPHSGQRPAAEPRTHSSSDGSFTLSGERLAGCATLTSPEWVALFEPSFNTASKDPVLVIAAQAVRMAGSVVDSSTLPVADAELTLLIPDELRTRFPAVLDTAPPIERSTRSDAHGRFGLERLPSAPGVNLRVRHSGFETSFVAVPERSRENVVIVLELPRDASSVLSGVVVDPKEAPVPDALVALGVTSVHTDAKGAFTLRLDSAGEGRVLQAVKQGFLPARLECATGSPRDRGAWPEPLVLRLAEASISIAGVVHDARDRPLPRAPVSIVDQTLFGQVEMRFGTDIVMVEEGIESMLNPQLNPHHGAGCILTDEQGRFRIDGLLPRRYTLQAFDKQTLDYGQERSVEAGRADVVLQLSCTTGHSVIRGRVVNRSGAPVVHAQVVPRRKIPGVRYDTESMDEVEASGEGKYTDSEGRFELDGYCRDTSSLLVSHESSVGSITVPLSSSQSRDGVEIVLPLQCHVQVDLENSSLHASSLHILDGKGEPVHLAVYHGYVSYGFTEFPIQGRKTEAFVVSDEAATLVLIDGVKEVQRIRLFLRAGELNVIRP